MSDLSTSNGSQIMRPSLYLSIFLFSFSIFGCSEPINPNQSSLKINFLVLSKTKHTIILEAKQSGDKKNIHSNFVLRIQISLDAKLAEVLSYQGEKPLPFFMNQSKRQSSDEKLQQNQFLTEWLESIFVAGISDREQISNFLNNA